MSSLRVGQGRSYVKLGPGPVPRVDFGAWCDGLAAGRSYVSDGFAHALEFRVNGAAPGDADVQLAGPGRVRVHAAVAFAARRPQGVAYGDPPATGSPRDIGDTVLLHGPRKTDWIAGDEQLVEVVRNGQAVASARVLADGRIHMLDLEIEVDRSSWISLRQFPQMHTNPVNVLIGGRPIRASIESARWCGAAVEVLWERRHKQIAEAERPAAREAYDRAAEEYRRRGAEAGAP
jgi:hypothetical protein